MAFVRCSPEWILGHERARSRDLMRQVVILCRIDAIDAVAQKRNGSSTNIQRTAVCGGVDALGEAADDGVAAFCQIPRKFERVPQSRTTRAT